MKRFYTVVVAMALLAPPLAFSDTFSFRMGYFFPRAEGGPDSLWNIEFEQMSFKKSDYRQSFLGFSYEYFISKEFSLALTLDTCSKQKVGYYLDYVGYSLSEADFAFPASDYKGSFDIVHGFNVSITPLQLSVKIMPFGRRARIIPYVGGGISLFIWSASIRGSMIDFEDDEIYSDDDLGDVTIYAIKQADIRESGRIAVGYHAFAGLMFPIGNRITIEAEFRYHVGKGKFTDAFKGFEEFDLGGYALSAGLNYWF